MGGNTACLIADHFYLFHLHTEKMSEGYARETPHENSLVQTRRRKMFDFSKITLKVTFEVHNETRSVDGNNKKKKKRNIYNTSNIYTKNI